VVVLAQIVLLLLDGAPRALLMSSGG